MCTLLKVYSSILSVRINQFCDILNIFLDEHSGLDQWFSTFRGPCSTLSPLKPDATHDGIDLLSFKKLTPFQLNKFKTPIPWFNQASNEHGIHEK